jgi:hypothetical protein
MGLHLLRPMIDRSRLGRKNTVKKTQGAREEEKRKN